LFAGPLLGSLIYKWIFRANKAMYSWHAAIVGLIVMHFVKFIPIFGWIFVFFFVILAFGTIAKASYTMIQSMRR
jgi:hypothetical protein